MKLTLSVLLDKRRGKGNRLRSSLDILGLECFEWIGEGANP